MEGIIDDPLMEGADDEPEVISNENEFAGGDDDFADEEDDLSDVSDPEYPEDGWHKVKITATSSKPTKAGDKSRRVCMTFRNGYQHWEGFVIGSRTGGDVAKRRYKSCALACGIEETDGKFNLKVDDLRGCELYVMTKCDPKASFPLRVNAFRLITDAPDDITSDISEEIDDGLPF